MEDDKLVYVSSSPQIHGKKSTSSIMWTFFCVLLFPALWGVFVFGFSALVVLVATTGTALLAEFAISRLVKKSTVWDGSAAITGLLIGMNMPPQIPLYIPICSTLFAIVIVKWAFGGLGNNWANPAIAGRVFAFFSWSKPMMSWKMPALPWDRNFFTNAALPSQATTSSSVDSITGATPLSIIKEGINAIPDLVQSGAVVNTPRDLVQNMISTTGYQISTIDIWLTNFLNTHFHLSLKEGLIDPFIGMVPGSIGEVSALLLIAGGIFLLAKKIINYQIPLAFIGSFALLTWIFGGLPYRQGYFHGDIWYPLMSGGLMLGAIYMATDLVTTPVTPLGMVIFGIGCGVLTYLVRTLGNYPEGVSLAILFMNILTPLLDNFINPRKFGTKKRLPFPYHLFAFPGSNLNSKGEQNEK